ncbi:MAG: hypothetical protein DHS20C18_14670 [Saprospiraceae bacterium]|nr:MAG: hypothetical protein DHS20C18_14670 [Saprospiraceae bacterium]
MVTNDKEVDKAAHKSFSALEMFGACSLQIKDLRDESAPNKLLPIKEIFLRLIFLSVMNLKPLDANCIQIF